MNLPDHPGLVLVILGSLIFIFFARRAGKKRRNESNLQKKDKADYL